jgi:hypothetical protein
VVGAGFAQPRGGKEWGPDGARARAKGVRVAGSGVPPAEAGGGRATWQHLHGGNRGGRAWQLVGRCGPTREHNALFIYFKFLNKSESATVKIYLLILKKIQIKYGFEVF